MGGSKMAVQTSTTSLLPTPATPSKRMSPRGRGWMRGVPYLVVCTVR